METRHRIHPEVEAIRHRIHEARAAIRREHEAGLLGRQTSCRLSEVIDSAVQVAYAVAVEAAGDQVCSRLAVVAHSGLGRRDIAPYSDVDVMVVYAGPFDARLTAFARLFHQALCDTRLEVGFSRRSLRDVRRLVAQEATVLTSLSESRFLAGSQEVFDQYWSHLTGWVRRYGRRWVAKIAEARRDERIRYGETVYLLHPNVKRTRGGLRDIHLIRWVGFAVYGEKDFQRLEQLGALLPGERERLLDAYEFLLRIRHELHFHAGKAQDLLTRSEQVRLAEWYGFVTDPVMLAAEKFMRLYFDHTSDVRYVSSNFLRGALRARGVRAFFGWLFSRKLNGFYTVGPSEIRATRRGLAQLRGNLCEVMRLMEFAGLIGKRLDHDTWQAIRQDAADHQAHAPSPEAIDRFLSLMSCQTRDLGNLLRRLHQLRILERFIPPMGHARSLVQFNEYHKYTVDEHCIRAVEAATYFAEDTGLLGELYRQLPRKLTLHLALLLHDLGKGYGEDHSTKGAELAQATCQFLRLSAPETETIVRLVEHHLLMAHTAWRHDLNNDSVILGFSRHVGSVEFLRLLFLLTCADVAAVGPGTFTQWKFQLLTELYERTLEQLSPDASAWSIHRRTQQVRHSLLAKISRSTHRDWLKRQIEQLPSNYLQPGTEERLLQQLEELARMPHGEARAWGRYLPDQQLVEYTIGTTDDIVPGIFHRLTGVFTSSGHSILAAQIHTLADQLVLDRFYVQDLDYAGEPPQDRIADICRRLVDTLLHPTDAKPVFRRLWRSFDQSLALRTLPERVHWDNGTSAEHTIITVFAYDRMGLLYTISRTLFELGLSVHVAKIGTYLDQVVDVFYVTDQKGNKIRDEKQLHHIGHALTKALAAHAEQEAFSQSGVMAGPSR